MSSAVDFLEDTTLSADIGVYYSGTLRQRREELLNVTHKKRRLQPTELEDSLAEWIPVEADLVEPVDDAPDFAGEDTSSVLGKRKTYESSVSLSIYGVTRVLTICCVDRRYGCVATHGRFFSG
jgi:hypothetical protein